MEHCYIYCNASLVSLRPVLISSSRLIQFKRTLFVFVLEMHQCSLRYYGISILRGSVWNMIWIHHVFRVKNARGCNSTHPYALMPYGHVVRGVFTFLTYCAFLECVCVCVRAFAGNLLIGLNAMNFPQSSLV